MKKVEEAPLKPICFPFLKGQMLQYLQEHMLSMKLLNRGGWVGVTDKWELRGWRASSFCCFNLHISVFRHYWTSAEPYNRLHMPGLCLCTALFSAHNFPLTASKWCREPHSPTHQSPQRDENHPRKEVHVCLKQAAGFASAATGRSHLQLPLTFGILMIYCEQIFVCD